MNNDKINDFFRLSFYDKFKANLYKEPELRNIITIKELKILLMINYYNQVNNNIGVTISTMSKLLGVEKITLTTGKIPSLQNRNLIYWIKSIANGKHLKRFHLTGHGRHLLHLIELYFAGYSLSLRKKCISL